MVIDQQLARSVISACNTNGRDFLSVCLSFRQRTLLTDGGQFSLILRKTCEKWLVPPLVRDSLGRVLGDDRSSLSLRAGPCCGLRRLALTFGEANFTRLRNSCESVASDRRERANRFLYSACFWGTRGAVIVAPSSGVSNSYISATGLRNWKCAIISTWY